MEAKGESKWDFGCKSAKDDKIINEGKDDCEEKWESSDDKIDPPTVNVSRIVLRPNGPTEISSPLELRINFDLDRDVIAGYWIIKFLVDSADKRIIRILGETDVEDYPDGDSEMRFDLDRIDISGIPPSTLTNSGLLMACLMADGEEVASVNMVVNVFEKSGKIMREILSPLE